MPNTSDNFPLSTTFRVIRDDRPKRIAYQIYSSSSSEFKESFERLAAAGFVYRNSRFKTFEETKSVGYSSYMVIFGHPECKMTILSKARDFYSCDVLKTIGIDEFFAQNLHVV